MIDCRTLGVQLGDPSLGVVTKRLLALDIRRKRGIQPVELGKPPNDRVSPRAGRRQLMRKLGRAFARFRQFVTALVEKRRGLILRLLRVRHRALQRRDLPFGFPRLLRRCGRCQIRLDPAGVNQPSLSRADLV